MQEGLPFPVNYYILQHVGKMWKSLSWSLPPQFATQLLHHFYPDFLFLCWASTCRFCTSLEKTPGTGCCFNIINLPAFGIRSSNMDPQRILYLPPRGGDKAVAEMFLPLRSIVENRASWTFLRNHPKNRGCFLCNVGCQTGVGIWDVLAHMMGGEVSTGFSESVLNCNKKLGDWVGQVFFVKPRAVHFQGFTCFKVKHIHTFCWFWTLTMARPWTL